MCPGLKSYNTAELPAGNENMIFFSKSEKKITLVGLLIKYLLWQPT
jgi:hypothetical protein